MKYKTEIHNEQGAFTTIAMNAKNKEEAIQEIAPILKNFQVYGGGVAKLVEVATGEILEEWEL